MNNIKIENLAYRLKDLDSLRNLFSELNYDFSDKPVNKDSWSEEEKDLVYESRIIANKGDYQIYYIQTNTDSLKQWKGIATKIIKNNNGFCMVCSHNPSGFKWIFSSLAKEFSKKFSETRHVPIDIKPNAGVSKTFIDFLENVRITENFSASSIMDKISEAFDCFAIQIGGELTGNMFEALKTLSEGIISDTTNNLTLNAQTIEKIREPIFILLYRIMFILYAEDRGVFPDNDFYHDNFSIKWIKINWVLNPPHTIAEYDVNKRLRKLFRLIEMGSEDLDYDPNEFIMRSYYGKLFDRKIHATLEKWNIPNKNLLNAISLLTRTKDGKGNYFFLDYAALETRHLGAIYERLLEFHLHVKKNKIVDLTNTRDRRSTGSYYTPKYIVDYIVENTIGPLIDDIIDQTNDPSEQIDNILTLNILDPAMGSGHFLVGVVNYIAKRICKIECYDEYIDEQMLTERKRDVARKCIYGVDLNPLAVDLASVSLWLETLSSEKPLSFLSAHLKSGNSLIGSNIEDMLEAQLTLTESSEGRTRFKKIIRDSILLENLEDDTASAVKTKITKYDNMRSRGTGYYDLKSFLNVKLAKQFGVNVPPIKDFIQKVGKNGIDYYMENNQFKEVDNTATKYSFFHWELVFSDIFYDQNGKRKKNPGFDAIIGNPPYIHIDTLPNIIKQELRKFECYSPKTDVLYYFYNQGINLLKRNGMMSFITSRYFMEATFAKNLRHFILNNTSIKKIIDMSNLNVFKNISIHTAILTLKKEFDINNKIEYVEIHDKHDLYKNAKNISLQSNLNSEHWIFGNEKLLNLFNKIDTSDNAVRLEHIADISMVQQCGINDAFIVNDVLINNHSLESNYVRPLVKNGDIHNYYIHNNINHIIYTSDSTSEENSFNILKYLSQFKNQLLDRADARDGKYPWYRFHRPRSKKLFNAEEKLLVPYRAKYNKFGYDDQMRCGSAGDVYSILIKNTQYDLKYLLPILNSKLMNFYYPFIGRKKGEQYEYFISSLKKIPIYKIDNKGQQSITKISDDILKSYKEYYEINNKFIKMLIENFKIKNSVQFKGWVDINYEDLLYKIKKSSKKTINFDEQIILNECYNNEKNKLVKLMHCIQDLKNRVDLIVYSLYDITNDEIKLIQKSTSHIPII
ncbi:MAG: restriction endonuclease [Cenarchaeum symbiont of Oopsacas minuta]|nr:restriction endonuclease [Cenarchaeum symbiont of Oopsacas minuta]